MLKDKIKETTAFITALGTLITTLSNQKCVKALFNFMGSYKEYSIIIITTILLVVIIFMLVKIFKNSIDLKNHKFFSQMDFYVGYNIDNLETTLKKERLVFTDSLRLKICFWKKHCQILVSDYESNKIKSKQYFKIWFMNGVKEQNQIFKDNNIPVIVNKIINKWHARRITSTLNFILKLSQSNTNYKYMINALLTYLDNAFDETI
ncbi:hypothetical protein QUF55_07825, partial [Clostridiaceae bacterium HSG29]|nr:hypothetical protein [Clostridiaceae bacterium HSG29]